MRKVLQVQLLLALGMMFWSPILTASFAAAPQRIGIVPLSCPACSEQLQAYARGTQDNLIDGLGHVPELVVVDRSRMEEVLKELAFQESAYAAPESAVKIGQVLGVDYLYTGSLQQAGEEVRILVQQVNVASGESKALGKVTGSVGQIFSLQDQLVSQILSAHGVSLAPAQQQALQQQLTLTQKPEAYAVYVQALGSEESENPATSGQALAQLDKAIALDGNFAEAYHHRALLHLRKHDFVRARADLDAAIRLNPNDGGMYFARGRLLLEQKQFQAAVADLDKAVALQPSLAQAWNSRGQAWLALQQSAKALADFNRALELDPSHYFALLNRAEAYGRGKAWQQAQQDLSRATRLFPRRPAAFVLSGQFFEAQGRCREAHEAWQKACKLGLRKLCRQRCKG